MKLRGGRREKDYIKSRDISSVHLPQGNRDKSYFKKKQLRGSQSHCKYSEKSWLEGLGLSQKRSRQIIWLHFLEAKYSEDSGLNLPLTAERSCLNALSFAWVRSSTKLGSFAIIHHLMFFIQGSSNANNNNSGGGVVMVVVVTLSFPFFTFFPLLYLYSVTKYLL